MAYYRVKRHFMAQMKAALYDPRMNVTPLKKFGDRLKDALTAADISQAELARRTKITPQAVNQWTVAKLPPELTLDRWVFLSRLLNINLEWLAYGVGNRERVDMDERAFDVLRRFKQLDPAHQEIISTSINVFLGQQSPAHFAEGNRR
jgi:transcriptional regulator with XRE-family HTH domain